VQRSRAIPRHNQPNDEEGEENEEDEAVVQGEERLN